MMNRSFLLIGLCFATACGDDGPTGSPDGGGGGADGGSVTPDGGSATPDGGSVTPDGGSSTSMCPVVGFTPCGGDVVGTWNVIEFCPEDDEAFQALCESPFSDRAACVGGGNDQHCQFHREGSLELAAGGTFDFPLTARIEASYTFDDACLTDLALVSGGPDAQCTELDAGPNLACSYAAGACSCTSVTDPEDQTTSGTYTVDGTQLSIDFGGGKVSTGDYCIDGDVLTIDVTPHPVAWRYWIFRR